MENLRWILLAAGIFFILAIYFVGRQRRRQNSSDLFDSKEELPEFTARDWDELDEGVGEVRVVARENDEHDFAEAVSVDQHHQPTFDMPESELPEQNNNQDSELQEEDGLFTLTDEVDPSMDEQDIVEDAELDLQEQKSSDVDIVVLYILARTSDQLTGDKINSAAQANGLTFGRMNIFHRLDGEGQTIFSLANMMEPGNFDPDSIHEMTTTGLTIFMQLSNLSNPADDFDEMLRSAYHISEMLGASLCSQNQQPITQADAEYYRKIISDKENA